MGYSDQDNMVRVDFFKSSGKWKYTEAIKWTGGWNGIDELIHEAFAKSLRDHFKSSGRPNRLSDLDAICLEPFHQYSHPICLKQGEWNKI